MPAMTTENRLSEILEKGKEIGTAEKKKTGMGETFHAGKQ